MIRNKRITRNQEESCLNPLKYVEMSAFNTYDFTSNSKICIAPIWIFLYSQIAFSDPLSGLPLSGLHAVGLRNPWLVPGGSLREKQWTVVSPFRSNCSKTEKNWKKWMNVAEWSTTFFDIMQQNLTIFSYFIRHLHDTMRPTIYHWNSTKMSLINSL